MERREGLALIQKSGSFALHTVTGAQDVDRVQGRIRLAGAFLGVDTNQGPLGEGFKRRWTSMLAKQCKRRMRTQGNFYEGLRKIVVHLYLGLL